MLPCAVRKISTGSCCIVRNGKGLDADVADFKACAGLEQPPVNFRFESIAWLPARGLVFLLHFFLERPNGSVLRVTVAINRDVEFIGDAKKSGDVVRSVRA